MTPYKVLLGFNVGHIRKVGTIKALVLITL
jgi:hypothetical protein